MSKVLRSAIADLSNSLTAMDIAAESADMSNEEKTYLLRDMYGKGVEMGILFISMTAVMIATSNEDNPAQGEADAEEFLQAVVGDARERYRKSLDLARKAMADIDGMRDILKAILAKARSESAS
jgi:hypothetical protein